MGTPDTPQIGRRVGPVSKIDTALELLQRRRERVAAEPASISRSICIALLYEREARLWSALFEHSRSRVHWRAALAAEAYARSCAKNWWRRTAAGPPAPTLPARREEPA